MKNKKTASRATLSTLSSTLYYTPPPDKSITLRAIIFTSIAEGTSVIENPSICADTVAAVNALKKLGVKITVSPRRIKIIGVGPNGLKPVDAVSAGESATFMRIFSPILACQEHPFVFRGERTLLKRSMKELVEKLSVAGLSVRASSGYKPPLTILPARARGGCFRVSSAQIKSALLAAGLYSDKPVHIFEEKISRDHTERMLKVMGADIKKTGRWLSVRMSVLKGSKLRIPGDISACAPFITAAFLMGKNILIKNCGLNPTRDGFLKVLAKMGFRVEIRNLKKDFEVSGDVLIFPPARPKPVKVFAGEIPSMIDEIPFLAFISAFSAGSSLFAGLSQLRNKESDRLIKIFSILTDCGFSARLSRTGLYVKGSPPSLKKNFFKTGGDHRIAMFGPILSIINPRIQVDHPGCVSKSYPSFWKDFRRFSQK